MILGKFCYTTAFLAKKTNSLPKSLMVGGIPVNKNTYGIKVGSSITIALITRLSTLPNEGSARLPALLKTYSN